MLFNSFTFPLFFAIVWLLYVRLQHRAQNVLLLLASYVFYGWWDWRFLSLLFISTVVDYNCAHWIKRYPQYRKQALLLSLCTNLGILGFFKYFNFFADSATRVFESMGMQLDYVTLTIILPVGISFYTFQTLAYTIDVYRGKETPTDNILSFALYVAFFPQLVAGPIERSTHLLPQIERPRIIEPQMIYTGLQLILMGFFKKVFIADGVAPLVDDCFTSPEKYGGFTLFFGVWLFALQIYGDFAGYTDIARGVSRLLGIELCLNFRQPYLSPNITEFWRRWHMSLSAWLRDYLYIPLGGNRKGEARTYINNMLTMLLGGLWHGAGWNFVIWGGLHGGYLAVHKFMLKGKKVGVTTIPREPGPFMLWLGKVFVTFNLVCLAWVFFRASSLANALDYLTAIAAGGTYALPGMLMYVLFYGFFAVVIDYLCFRDDREVPFVDSWPRAVRGSVYALLIVLLIVIGESNAQPFIYFQF